MSSAATKGSSLRRAAVLSLTAAFLLVALAGGLAGPVHASDDSNAGPLGQVPTVTPQQLNSALSTLEQGTNDTQIQQLIASFQSAMAGGNYTQAASTLVQLQQSANDTSLSPSLNALLQSLSVGSDGATVNSGTLAGLLSSGAASQTASESPQQLSVDMQSLANLMQYANSTMASELLQNSSLFSQNAFSGANGVAVGAGHVSLPGVSAIPGISVPSVGAPSLSVGTPSTSSFFPPIPLVAFAVPLAAAAAIAGAFFFRRRIAGLVGTQRLPGSPLLKSVKNQGEREAEALVPTDPRSRIEYYFGRTVNLMAHRGVSKQESETHREFSSNCEGTREEPHVSAISSLYEKAKFSGQDIGGSDAYLAATSFLAMEKEER